MVCFDGAIAAAQRQLRDAAVKCEVKLFFSLLLVFAVDR